MHTTLVFDRRVRGTLVKRDRLVFDTRYAAAAAGRVEPVGHVFLILEGRYVPADGAPIASPVALVLADDEIERVTPRSPTFRTDGDRVHVVHLRFDRGEIAVPIGIAHGPRAITEACWAAAQRALDTPIELPVLLDALAAARITRRAVPIVEEPERYRRLWDALRPLYQTYGGSASLKQLADRMGMSMRQAGRDAKELANELGFSGYRETLLVLRLRVAVLLLSAPEATIAEVAAAVGYGSPIAMARAFRDAKLPAPTVVQAALRQ